MIAGRQFVDAGELPGKRPFLETSQFQHLLDRPQDSDRHPGINGHEILLDG
jgi:hypothetical protein